MYFVEPRRNFLLGKVTKNKSIASAYPRLLSRRSILWDNLSGCAECSADCLLIRHTVDQDFECVAASGSPENLDRMGTCSHFVIARDGSQFHAS